MTPRDIPSGVSYPNAIANAIQRSDQVILLLSKHSAASPQVLNEVEIAGRYGKPIIPFCLDDADPSFLAEHAKDMFYYIARKQWIDATEGNLVNSLQQWILTLGG